MQKENREIPGTLYSRNTWKLGTFLYLQSYVVSFNENKLVVIISLSFCTLYIVLFLLKE
jgi:hypothetical protein